MITHLIDTNILSYYARNQYPRLQSQLDLAILQGTVGLSAIVRAELSYGLELMNASDKRRVQIPRIISELPTLAWGSQEADIYGRIDAQLHKAGQTIGIFDAMIAAHALSHKLVLVTHNTQHFARIDGLKLEDWTQ